MGCVDFPRCVFNVNFIIPLVLRRGEPALVYDTSRVPVFYHNLNRGFSERHQVFLSFADAVARECIASSRRLPRFARGALRFVVILCQDRNGRLITPNS